MDNPIIPVLLILALIVSILLAVDIANNPRLEQITQCEKDLTRNQKCVLIAVPEKDND